MVWWHGGDPYWHIAMMVAFWGVIIVVMYLTLRAEGRRRHPSARQLLDERFVSGELSEVEYERKRATLEHETSAEHAQPTVQ